jgi:hypothetical protein
MKLKEIDKVVFHLCLSLAFFFIKFALLITSFFWNQTSSSSQRTKPSTADKGIQCEILTSEGIMMPWEKLVTPYSENDTEDTVLPESESLKAMQGYGDKLETLEHRSVEPVSAQCGTRETKS